MSGPSIVDLAERRLLGAARTGDLTALGTLWTQEVDLLWSISVGLVPEEDAVHILGAVRALLRDQARGLDGERGFRAQVLELLWGVLADELEPQSLASIIEKEGAFGSPRPPARAREPEETRARVRAAIEAAPLELRMLHLFDILGGCSAAELSRFSHEPDAVIRSARTLIAYRVMGALAD